jgi:hypothetical protein
MEAGEITIIEILTVNEAHVEEAKEMAMRVVAYDSQVPGVHRIWVIQDAQQPNEFAFVGLVDAERVAEIDREIHEADWYKAMAPRWHEILVPGRWRRLIGPAVG